MKKRSGGGESGANWMDTYGDMVTLLLCFFVLLYSMSTVDARKFEIIVKSFNPNAKVDSQIVMTDNGDVGEYDVEGGIDPENIEILEDFEDLVYTLTEAIQTAGMGDDIEVSSGDGFIFINFRDNVFFDGNSYSLKPEGQGILDKFANILAQQKESIDEIQVMGHTSQATAQGPVNNVANDRFLASNRATIVLVYLQEKNIFDPSKLIASGYGQYRPIAPFDTPEHRAKNRRVEMLITRKDSVVRSLEDYYQEIYSQ